MIEVYLWEGMYGHAALRIVREDQANETYISFHPIESKDKVNPFHMWSGLTDFVGHGKEARTARNLDEDIAYIGAWVRESDPTAENPGHPKAIVRLNTLNESALLKHWQRILKEQRRYKALFNNCSTVVMQCLCVGWATVHSNFPDDVMSDEALEEEMEKLRRAVIFTRYRRMIRGVVEVAVYRYTGETVEESSVIHEVNKKSILISQLSLLFAAGMSFWLGYIPVLIGTTVGVLGVTSAVFSKEFYRYIWEPQMVHNIALYMKEPEYSPDEQIKRKEEQERFIQWRMNQLLTN